MEKQQIITFIRTVPLFHELPPNQLEQLADAAEQCDYSEGELLAERDKEARALVILVQGELQAFLRQNAISFEKEVTRLYPGDYFGAAAVIGDERNEVSVRALCPSRAIVLSKETISNLFESSSTFGRAVCRSLAHFLRQSVEQVAAIPFVQLDTFPRLKWAAELLPPRISRYCRSLVVHREGDTVKVAMVDPSDAQARSFICDVLHQYHVEVVAVSEGDFNKHAAKLLGRDISLMPEDALQEGLTYIDSTGQTSNIGETSAQDVLPRSLATAIRGGASDLHIEPFGDRGRIRMRLDGKMVRVGDDIDPSLVRQIVSRIKVMADLDITNVRRPQDGRTIIQAGGRRVEVRVSVTPCQGGEKAVLRLVAPDPYLENLDNLILSRPVSMFAHDVFRSPSGLVLVTGPTGAGKTTTLYAALNMINTHRPTLNIVTIEDPVEYSLKFATQTQVDRNHGLDFTRLLRTVLRQDPDVILVGEIRDSESAGTTFEAANTGHFVLSTLHTYSALETLVRLRNLGVKPYLAASGLKGVISQKLVPRLCPGCTAPILADDPVVGRLKDLGILPNDWSGTLLRGIERDECPPDGESGRVGVYEIMAVTPEIRRLIEVAAPITEIEQRLDAGAFFSFARYSRLLLEDGIVSPDRIEEIFPKRRFRELADLAPPSNP